MRSIPYQKQTEKQGCEEKKVAGHTPSRRETRRHNHLRRFQGAKILSLRSPESDLEAGPGAGGQTGRVATDAGELSIQEGFSGFNASPADAAGELSRSAFQSLRRSPP